MNQQDLARIHESIPHGDLRFHMMLHTFSSDVSRSERISAHWHKEFELLVLTNGNGIAHINHLCFPVSSGDILFINSGEVHSVSAPVGTPLDIYAVVFDRDLIASYGNDDIQQKYISRQANGELIFHSHFTRSAPAYPMLLSALSEIHSLYCSGRFSDCELLLKSDLLRIWHYLCQYPEASTPSFLQEDSKILLTKEILNLIHENYAEPLTLSLLSTHFHMSQGQFCRFFKSQVNMTPIEYLNYYRIGVSCDLLSGTVASISSIAISCGYNNISYFNRTFQKYMHCTPKQYRQKTCPC